MSDLLPRDHYEELLADLRQIIAKGRGQAIAAIHTAMVNTYWQIGERIIHQEQAGKARAAFGEQVLARLGHALSREFGRGFAEQSSRAIRQFYQAYPIRSAARSEYSWTHYRSLM